MYHYQKLKSLLLLLLVAVTAKAQLEHGKVYNFVNVHHSTKSMVISSDNFVGITDTDSESYDQLWYVSKNSDGSYSLRSLGNGLYLRSSNVNLERWTFVKDIDDNCKFNYIDTDTGYSLRATNTNDNNHYMHYGSGSGRIVCYHTNDNATRWNFNEVFISDDELNTNWEVVTALNSGDIYQTALSNLFTDNSCSELKDAYKSYTTAQMQANQYYLQLSETLQKMVLKVLSDNWEETNYDTEKLAWESDYAKKYRVQLYEPYNEPEAAASALGINAHTNLNNPTGIFSDGRDIIYVMVEGAIKDGASLYLASYTGNGELYGYDEGVELNEGLNIIPSYGAGNNYCINYVIHTFDTEDGTKKGNKAKVEDNRLSNFPDLKIHIEGGYINGYWNKVGDELYAADTNDSWEYIEARATQTTVTVLGEYITLQFPLLDEHTVDTNGNTNKGLKSFFNDLVKVEDVIDEWDNVMMWERFLLGVAPKEVTTSEKNVKSPYSESIHVVEYTGEDGDAFAADYGDYYNVHGLSYGIPNSYMYGGWRHCGYNFNTMGSIIGEICTSAGSHWGPGHEIGHQHQGIFNMRGLTEVTNNLFSNVVLWYFGETTSRVNGTEGSLSNVLAAYNTEGSDFFTNNIWAQTHMYYKMFLYYHVLGHNPKFYPRLFEMLRQDPMNIQYEQSGAESLLHFYKKCCYASGEDLTEFFRAYGFFRVMTDRFVGDYSNAVYNQTQAEIDAAIAEVKAWAEANNAKENIALLFINDATDETIESHKGDNLDLYGESIVCSEMGGYATFEQSITEGAELEFTMSGQNVTVSAGGGVGYAIYNKDGEIIAFSDKKTFAISDECATALMWGEATMKVINADNTTTEVEVVDEVATKYALLEGLIDEVNTNVLQYVDETNKTVGYYISGELDELKEVLEEAQEVYDNQTVNSYTAMYTKLSQVYSEVTHNDYNRIAMVPGVYRLKNRNHSDRWMSVDDSKAAVGESGDESSTKQQWTFESAGEEGLYYIKNVSTQLYLGSLVKNNQISANAAKADAKGYRLTAKGTGIWLVTCQDDNRMSLNWNANSGKVLGWDGEGEAATQWMLTAVSVEEDAKKLQELSALVKKTKELIDEMAVVTPTQKQTLQTESTSSPFYLSTNACHNTLNGVNDGQGLAGLLDEDVATYFHSDYSGHDVGTHYLQVDLGGVVDLSEYIFYYTTRDNGNNCPTTIEVWGSTDGTTFNDLLYTFDSGLPTDGKQTWESPMLTAATTYSSLRFMVTAAEGGKKFFVMSRFGIAKCEATVESMGEEYRTKGLTEAQLVAAYGDIHAALNKIKVGGATSGELETLCGNLLGKYDDLLAIYENAENAAFTAKQAELQTWITTLNGFFGDSECGTVTPVNATSFTLSTTNSNDAYYLTGGPGAASEGNIDNLLEENVSSYYVSYWGDKNESPYLQVRLPEGKKLSEFTFTFTSRDGGKAPTPTEIVVSGSNDGTTFTPIETFNDGFPEAANTNDANAGKAVTWLSPTITASTAYQYLRFTVTKSHRPTGGETDANGFYHYSISKFGLGTPSGYNITLGANAGGVTEELLLESYNVVATASATLDMATTEAQLQKAIDKLQEQKTALEQARQLAVKYSVVVVGGNGNGGVIYNNGEYKSGAQFDAAPGLTAEAFTPISLGNGYTTGEITMEGTTITVTYHKKYTVQITGGEGEGRVVYNGGEYENADIIEVPSTIDGVTATDVEGYTKSEVTVNHETGVISVTYTLDTSALNDLLEETLGLIYVCNGFVNSEFVTDELLEETNIAWTTAQTALETVQTRSELNDALGALQTANTTLTQAKISAEAEAAERTELNVQLSALITETEKLIASCYENEVLKFVNSEFVTEETISSVRTLVEAAKAKCSTLGTTAAEFNNSITALTEAKNTLATAIENAEEEAAERVQLKADLQALVDNTNSLMALCGEIRTAPATTLSGIITLQTTDSANNFYLSTNAQEETEGPIAGLTDDDASTFFHSSWNARIGEAHYLQVDMGEQYALKEFAFGYVTRNNGGGGPHPSTIVVSGSNSKDEDSFVELSVINSGLPTGGNTSWSTTENVVTPKMPYRYLRFTVTQSAGTNECKHSNPDEYFFTMSKFSLTAVPTEATPYADVNEKAGVVTETQLLEVYYEKESAQSIINSANNTELTAAKEALQAKYDALNLAYTTVNKSELEALLPEVEALINSCYTDETFNYTGSLYVTTELMEEVNGVVTAARNALDNTVSQDVYDAALADLKNAQAKLQYAVDHVWLPVILTTNIEEPVLYTLKSKRGDGKTLQYDPSDNHMFSIADESAGSVKQIFFFIEGDAATQVYVYPFAAGEQVLAAVDLSAGKEKVVAADVNSTNAMAMQWIFEQETLDDGTTWYSLDGIEAPYFSNWGGGSNKMGFLGSKDDGSRFQFVEVDESTIEGSSAYHSLKVYYDEVVKKGLVGGDDPGYYPKKQVDDVNAAYENATPIYEAAINSKTYNEYFAAYKTLYGANEALVLNMPSAGKFYRLKSVGRGTAENPEYAYVKPEENRIFHTSSRGVDDATTIWTFTEMSNGMYKMTNLHTGTSLANNGWAYYTALPLYDEAEGVNIVSLSLDGQVGFKCDDIMLHADGNGKVVHWSTGANDGSAWRIVEIEDMSLVKFAVSISQFEHAGLYLNYPVSIPDNVKAYYLDGSKISIDDDGVGTLNLTKIEDEVIPARTAVILYAPHGEQTIVYDFQYAEEPIGEEYTNLFTGSSYQTYREAEGNHYYYVFGQNKGEIGLYKNGVKYDATGAEGTTHYKMSANKILFDWDNNTTATMVKSFRFRLGTGGQTTSLEDALMMDNAIIYDLYGRRIPEVKTSGLYIINGEKRYMQVK